MFWAVDLVKNQQKKNPFNTGEEKLAGKPLVVDRIAAKMMGNGVFIQAWMSHFVIAPPLIISKDEIDRGVAALAEALALADAEVEA